MATKKFSEYAIEGQNVTLTYDNINDTVTFDVVVDKNDVGLGNVDNTSDADKPISDDTQTALNLKQDSLGFTPVTNARTLTINGTSYDLTANRSWSVGDLVSSGSYSNPTWLTALAWGKITSTPTTLSGYGITDAVPSNRSIALELLKDWWNKILILEDNKEYHFKEKEDGAKKPAPIPFENFEEVVLVEAETVTPLEADLPKKEKSCAKKEKEVPAGYADFVAAYAAFYTDKSGLVLDAGKAANASNSNSDSLNSSKP